MSFWWALWPFWFGLWRGGVIIRDTLYCNLVGLKNITQHLSFFSLKHFVKKITISIAYYTFQRWLILSVTFRLLRAFGLIWRRSSSPWMVPPPGTYFPTCVSSTGGGHWIHSLAQVEGALTNFYWKFRNWLTVKIEMVASMW